MSLSSPPPLYDAEPSYPTARLIVKIIYCASAVSWALALVTMLIGGIVVGIIYSFSALPNLEGIKFVVALPFAITALLISGACFDRIAKAIDAVFPSQR